MGSLDRFLAQSRPYFTIDSLEGWRRRGHEIGFHTHTHPFCSGLSDESFQREVNAPVTLLKSSLDLTDLPFAYPFGDHFHPEHETKLRQSNVFSALLGTAGFSTKPIDAHALERIDAENGVDQEVFGKPLLRAYKRTRLA